MIAPEISLPPISVVLPRQIGARWVLRAFGASAGLFVGCVLAWRQEVLFLGIFAFGAAAITGLAACFILRRLFEKTARCVVRVESGLLTIEHSARTWQMSPAAVRAMQPIRGGLLLKGNLGIPSLYVPAWAHLILEEVRGWKPKPESLGLREATGKILGNIEVVFVVLPAMALGIWIVATSDRQARFLAPVLIGLVLAEGIGAAATWFTSANDASEGGLR